MTDDLREASLDYHRFPKPGKMEIVATKKMVNQRDLALAYSPGVAAACEEIVRDPNEVASLTSRGNLVAVITNGTAVLGLGAIGPLAAKPVMEGKAVLFKKFAGVDVFDIELDLKDPEKIIETVAAMEPTFGGINLEDIKAPECFEIERRLRERMNIPVFHDDQHGTAIVVAAAVRNGLRVAGKKVEEVRLVCTGAGAAALACLNLLVSMGLKKENIRVVDRDGVVYKGRKEDMDTYKEAYAVETDQRTLDEVIEGADIFMGLSGPGVLKQHQVKKMANPPVILALANPTPEITPEEVLAVAPDAIIATGRSDYPNQVNNVLCFPFLFRGALDVGATTINEHMKIACVEALADLAMKEASDQVQAAYGGQALQFGREYLIPRPFDPRLMTDLPPKIAQAAMDSGVATRPIQDFHEYRRTLREFVFRSGLVMKPVFERAISNPQRVVFAEGEATRVLQAVQVLVDDGICKPILIGRPEVIEEKAKGLGLRFRLGQDVKVVNMNDNPNFERDWQHYHEIEGRNGVSPAFARGVVRTRSTVLAALLTRQGDADAMICGVEGAYIQHRKYIRSVIGIREDTTDCSAITMLILSKGTFFLTDTHVTPDPSPKQIAKKTAMAAEIVRRFGMSPKAALLSHSNFGSRDNAFSRKMKEARRILHEQYPGVVVEGEMHADSALSDEIRDKIFPHSRFKGAANLLVMPNLDSANISYNMVKMLGEAVPVGPMLTGLKYQAHAVSDSITVRGIVNMSAVAVVDAIDWKTTHAAG
ncbi:NADP-dependent malic enzyme [Sedimenticola selenatireducens]|uniref:NADP-dependent malic enzyme n=1 Tax=Sedimenticola selenatireducens TaxID=191960 RepID=A0A2N6CU26_9GAMM|nr:NADP-dependent malic enzyme [Sedimenticola selenatireducens]PLX60669.1 MAG: NADP-dependent malic enzyme [Sedimenticola selenatireducens]